MMEKSLAELRAIPEIWRPGLGKKCGVSVLHSAGTASKKTARMGTIRWLVRNLEQTINSFLTKIFSSVI